MPHLAFPRGWRRLVAASALLFAASMAVAGPVAAQMPNVPPDFINTQRRIGGDRITFCVDRQGMLFDFEVALAGEIAATLLVQASIHEYQSAVARRAYDYVLTATVEDIFVLLSNECDAILGMSLSSDTLGSWLALTRPLYQTAFVVVTRGSGGYRSLADIPGGARIGTRLGSIGELQLINYVRLLPEGARPMVLSYADNATIMERLLDGTIDAALLWEPALTPLAEAFGAGGGIAVIPAAPLTLPTLSFGIGLLANEQFLRSAIDGAIAAMVAGGRIDELILEHGVAAAPPGP